MEIQKVKRTWEFFFGSTNEASTWMGKKLGDEQLCDKAEQWRQIRVPSDGVTASLHTQVGEEFILHDCEDRGRGGSAPDTGM